MENKDLEIFDQQVDRFLRQQMTEAEEHDFKELLAEDPELRFRAKATALMVKEMLDIQAKDDRRIINMLKLMSEEQFRDVACEPNVDSPVSGGSRITVSLIKKRLWPKFVAYAAAACVIGLIIIAGYNYNLDNRAKILGGNSYANYELYLSDDTRGDSSAEDKLMQIFADVRCGENLPVAISQLEQFYQKATDNDMQYAAYKDDIAWVLSIAYLKTGDRKKPLPLLESIIESKKSYPDKVMATQQLLDKIKNL